MSRLTDTATRLYRAAFDPYSTTPKGSPMTDTATPTEGTAEALPAPPAPTTPAEAIDQLNAGTVGLVLNEAGAPTAPVDLSAITAPSSPDTAPAADPVAAAPEAPTPAPVSPPADVAPAPVVNEAGAPTAADTAQAVAQAATVDAAANAGAGTITEAPAVPAGELPGQLPLPGHEALVAELAAARATLATALVDVLCAAEAIQSADAVVTSLAQLVLPGVPS